MPIYEYQCSSCEYEFEMLQGISEAALVECPQCRAAELRLKLSAAAFHLKGTGWYETDFKNKDKKKDSKDAKSEKANTESESKSEDSPKVKEKSSKVKESSSSSASDSTA